MKKLLWIFLIVVAGGAIYSLVMVPEKLGERPKDIFTKREIAEIKSQIELTPAREAVLNSIVKGKNPRFTDFNFSDQDIAWAYQDLLEILGDNDNIDLDSRSADEMNQKIIDAIRKGI